MLLRRQCSELGAEVPTNTELGRHPTIPGLTQRPFVSRLSFCIYPTAAITELHHVSLGRPHESCDPASVHCRLLSDPPGHPHSISIQGSRGSAAAPQEKRFGLFDAFRGDNSWYVPAHTPPSEFCTLSRASQPSSRPVCGPGGLEGGGVYGTFLNVHANYG